MSVRKVRETLQTLRGQQAWTVADVQDLRAAAGPKVSVRERELLDTFLREHQPFLSQDVRYVMSQTFQVTPPSPAQLTLQDKRELDVKEASALVHLDGERFLIGDDEHGIYFDDGQTTTLLLGSKKHKGLAGIEGLCLSTDRSTLYALSEDTGTVYSMSLTEGEPPTLSKPVKLKELESAGRIKNKGWEGLNILPGRFSEDGKERLVAVNEKYPRVIGVFSLPDMELESTLKPPSEADKHLRDLSDLAICPKTGHFFVLSDESSSIVELKRTSKINAAPGGLLGGQKLEMVGFQEVERTGSSKAEGISFSEDGKSLFVSTESPSLLHSFSVTR
jgi:uncharacterized protein YjiK